jgi:hypothetical protein
MVRGEPWHINTCKCPNLILRRVGSLPSQVLLSGEVF